MVLTYIVILTAELLAAKLVGGYNLPCTVTRLHESHKKYRHQQLAAAFMVAILL